MDALRVDDSTRQGERTLSIAIGESRTDLVAVRQRVRDLLTSYPDVMVIDAVYVTDALATNAYDHGQAPIMLRLRLLPARRCLRIEADDTAVFSLPVVRGWSGTHGLGLLLVAHLATSWGVERNPGRKTVWAEVDLAA